MFPFSSPVACLRLVMRRRRLISHPPHLTIARRGHPSRAAHHQTSLGVLGACVIHKTLLYINLVLCLLRMDKIVVGWEMHRKIFVPPHFAFRGSLPVLCYCASLFFHPTITDAAAAAAHLISGGKGFIPLSPFLAAA
jgi:hypothetical protein